MLPTETTPPISPLAFAFWKLVEISLPLIVKVEISLTAEVVDESPIATSPVAVLAVAPRPNANVLSSAALAPAPRAVALTPEAAEPLPIDVAFSADAFALLPIAIAKSPVAFTSPPTATVQLPVAFA